MCIDKDFRLLIAEYRVGSPVIVGGKNTIVKRLPDGTGPIDGYIVSGDALNHTKEELKPVPLNEDFFRRHNSIFKHELGMYTCVGNTHVLTINKNYNCTIDTKEYGIVNTHELLNIMKDICNISILIPDGQ